MKCALCGCTESTVIESRGERRRRQCTDCRHRWTTREITERDLQVLEKAVDMAKQLVAVVSRAEA